MLNTLRRVTMEGSLKFPNFQVSPQRSLQLELKLFKIGQVHFGGFLELFGRVPWKISTKEGC